MLFSSRKAMSPLIATVLLIAFAVALGAMIMNWSADAVVDGGADNSKVCSEVSIQPLTDACYSDGQLTFRVKNDGRLRIDSMKLKSSSEIGDLELSVKDSSMISGESLERTIPFIYQGGQIQLDFLPVINSDAQLVECAGFRQLAIGSCN